MNGRNLNRRKQRAEGARAYHHGNLRAELLACSREVLAEKGVAGFSMREVARRADVSQSAPKHHFTDTRGLLTALAIEAFAALADRLEEADAGSVDHAKRISAQGGAYVSFAFEEPALFDVMWRVPMLDLSSPDLVTQKDRAFAILDRCVRGPDAPPVVADDPALAPTYACWSLVHGFARLALDRAIGGRDADRDELAAALVPAMIRLLDLPPEPPS